MDSVRIAQKWPGVSVAVALADGRIAAVGPLLPAAEGQEVLGLRFVEDPAVGKHRFDSLRRELGASFLAVEFPGKQHSTLTEHRQQEGVDRVLAFFADKLG